MIAVRLRRDLTSINNEELGAQGGPRSVREAAKQTFQSGSAALFWKICGPPVSSVGAAASPGSRS